MTTVDDDEDDELARSIAEADAERTELRVAAARQVKALAKQYDQLAAQIKDIVQQLHRAVTSAQDVFELRELASHTKRSFPELTEWAHGNDGKSAARIKFAGRTAKGARQDRRAPAARTGQLPAPPKSASPE